MNSPYLKCTLEIAKKSNLRASHIHLERQPALSVLTALTLCSSNWFKVDFMSGIKKNLNEVSVKSTEKSLSDVYKNQEISKLYQRGLCEFNFGVGGVVMHKRECFKAHYLKGISSIIVISFSSSVSVFEEVLEITSWWKKTSRDQGGI